MDLPVAILVFFLIILFITIPGLEFCFGCGMFSVPIPTEILEAAQKLMV